VALLQVEAATEAARRAAQPARTSFAIGFLTGYEMDWLPAVMGILRAELPSTEVVIHSQDSPDLAAGRIRGKIDLAFLRPKSTRPLPFKSRQTNHINRFGRPWNLRTRACCRQGRKLVHRPRQPIPLSSLSARA